ncbi:MAG: hypothetical protein KDD64_00885 [Bdellovibrionales bacterium]|nr:hypothetical protein [Bdellovibrionales bacterium]
MERFWEYIQDFGVMALKALGLFIILRGILFLAGYRLYIPYLDELIGRIYYILVDIIPALRID